MGLYETTLGTLVIGVFFNTFLYGLVIYQFASYYRMDFGDPPTTKFMVLFLFILDTLHSAAVIYMAWDYTVINYNNPAALAVAEWPHTLTPMATALTAFVTQIYLGARIRRLTNSTFLYVVVIVLAIPSFILGATCSVEAWIIGVFSEIRRITPLASAWLSMQVVADAFVTTTLIIIFARSRTGFRKTDTVLNRLIRGAVQTALFAGIFSIADLITFVVLPNTYLYGMFAIPIGRIYTNTLLDTLLSRESLKTELAGTYDMDRTTGPIGWARTDSLQTSSMLQSTSIQVRVQKTQGECNRSSAEDVEGKAIPLVV